MIDESVNDHLQRLNRYKNELTGNLEDFQTFIDFIVNYYNSKNRKP